MREQAHAHGMRQDNSFRRRKRSFFLSCARSLTSFTTAFARGDADFSWTAVTSSTTTRSWSRYGYALLLRILHPYVRPRRRAVTYDPACRGEMRVAPASHTLCASPDRARRTCPRWTPGIRGGDLEVLLKTSRLVGGCTRAARDSGIRRTLIVSRAMTPQGVACSCRSPHRVRTSAHGAARWSTRGIGPARLC